MADDRKPPHADEVPLDHPDERPDEAGEESFPASDPPATWSGPEESASGGATDEVAR
jgi:hypothetical protein